MKVNITILMVSLLTFAGIQSAHAQKTEDKVYGFGYAYSKSYKEQVLYVSNIVEGMQNSAIYLPATGVDLGNQWHDYFKASVDNYTSYHISKTGFIGKSVSSYNQIDEERTKMIGEYRQKGYEIRYLNNFRFRKKEYNN